MWNSGSDVISRSSAVSSIHHGNPSPAITYARCVCVTSFERPVVPEVGISTTGSSSPAGPVPPMLPVSANSPASGIDAAPETPASAGTSSSVTTTRGSTCAASPASSASLLRGLAVTTMAPM